MKCCPTHRRVIKIIKSNKKKKEVKRYVSKFYRINIYDNRGGALQSTKTQSASNKQQKDVYKNY